LIEAPTREEFPGFGQRGRGYVARSKNRQGFLVTPQLILAERGPATGVGQAALYNDLTRYKNGFIE